MESSLSSVMRFVALLVLVLAPAHGYRVLCLFPHTAYSHNIMFRGVMEALVDAGHEVVSFSPFPRRTARANYTDMDISAYLAIASHVSSVPFNQVADPLTRLSNMPNFIGGIFGPDMCRRIFDSKHFQDLMKGVHGKFDVVLTEVFGSDCLAAVAYKMQLPLISLSTQWEFPWANERVGQVDNPSYIVTYNTKGIVPRTFWERLDNTLMYMYNLYMHRRTSQDPSDAVVRQYFGADMPSVRELVNNVTSLVMVYGHDSVNPARPVSPGVVYVGGIHLRAARSPTGLDADLRRWMDGADHGVIVFALGSIARASTMPPAVLAAFREAFAALPQRVLWKLEDADGLDMPANVRVASWLPILDTLEHSKTVLFICHGGMMSTTEGVYAGVPMLGIPLWTDQFSNLAAFTHLGNAVKLDHSSISKDTILVAVRSMTLTDKYRKRAREVSALYRDRPRWATEEAVWWTEYVVRHRGARHLRPASIGMPLYQYLLLDVVAFLLAATLVLILAVLLLARALLARLLRTNLATLVAERCAEKKMT